MSAAFSNLLSDLDLKQLEDNIFRGVSRDFGGGKIFGGQVLGQSLKAAGLTVEDVRSAHSYHVYFLRSGDTGKPVIYDVERIRDGRSFTTRRVVAIQSGRPIFNCSITFTISEEGIAHQKTMPDVVAPNQLKNHQQIFQDYPDSPIRDARQALEKKIPFEIRPVEPRALVNRKKQKAMQSFWFKANGKAYGPQLQLQSMLAYASDFNFASTCALPHGLSGFSGNWQFSSLDHAIWFHAPLDMNDWHLYEMDSPVASSARGLNRGSIFSSAGQLVASVAQESLVRWVGKGQRPESGDVE